LKKRTRSILIGTGLVAAGVAAVSAISYRLTQTLVKVALDREQPKLGCKKRVQISGTVLNSKVQEEVDQATKWLLNCGCRTVEITARDGEQLVGHFYQCPNAERIIIAMHGWRSSWTNDFALISKFWHENNCSVLYAEQRGQGNSGGDYIGFGLTERYDCLDWIHFVNKSEQNRLPIYLAGLSMGASTVMMASGLKLPRNVCGIIADCGYTSIYEIWKHVSKNNFKISYGMIARLADDMCKKRIRIGTRDYSTTDALSANERIPVLFIHGTDDKLVPINMTYENYKACVAPKKLLVIPGAEHCMSYIVDTKAYERVIKEFWEQYDLVVVNEDCPHSTNDRDELVRKFIKKY